MLSLTQNILIMLFAMATSLLLMQGLNRFWPIQNRYAGNDQVGWQLNVLGTTYAVILGFMLYTSWTNFGAADLNTDLEANALRNVYRLAEGLPNAQRTQLETQARSYAQIVIAQDWPEMALGALPEESHKLNEQMWKTLMSVKTSSPSESLAEDHALSELSILTAHRRTRLLQSTSKLPAIFWCVLLVGGALILVSVSMFGSINRRLHALQVFSLTSLITLAMLSIADVNSPFQGWVHISDFAFRRALNNMQPLD